MVTPMEDDYPDHDSHESGIQYAKLVRIEVGESGWPLLQGV